MMAINKFQKVIVCLVLICFACILVGSVDMIRSQTIGVSNNVNLSILTGFAICLTCFLFVWKCFSWLDTLSEKRCFWFSLVVLILMTGVFIAVSFSARVSQYADSIDVLDTAFYLRNHLEVTEELPYIKYVGSFGNNYPVILFESFLIKILSWAGVQDIEMAMAHLNVVVLLAAVVFTWLIVKETKGIRAAAKTAVLCLLNPYFYLLVDWTYSMTYSLPVMMGILYVVLRLKKTKTTTGGIALALTEGALIGGGFMVRPTAVFPLIAVAMVYFPSFVRNIRKKINKRMVIQLFCILFAAVLVITFINIQVDRRFGKIKSLNMPLTFWLMMGSHGEGNWDSADLDAMMNIPDPEDRTKYALDQTLQNYIALGLDGTLDLWYRKLVGSWENGGFFHQPPVVSDGNALSDYLAGSGARNQLTKVYCQAFRLFMVLGILLACGFALARKRMPEITMIMMITIFGGAAFHIIWEANTRYSIPFILPMLTVIEYGMSTMKEYEAQKGWVKKISRMRLGLVLMGFLIIVCSSLSVALKGEKTLYFNRVFASKDTRVCAEIEPYDFTRLDQDFYTDKPFNSLFFKAVLPKDKTKADCSGYEVTIRNDEGKILEKSYLSPEKIGKLGVEISFDTISGYTHYSVRLEKTEPEKESIRFYTHYTYGVDPYRGFLTVDGGEACPSDLMMDVYETKVTTVFSNKARIAVILLILLLGAFIAFVPVGKKIAYS